MASPNAWDHDGHESWSTVALGVLIFILGPIAAFYVISHLLAFFVGAVFLVMGVGLVASIPWRRRPPHV